MEKRKNMNSEPQNCIWAERLVREKLGETIALLMQDQNERALDAGFCAVRACVDWLSPMEAYDRAAFGMFNDACMMMECAASSLCGTDAEKRAFEKGAELFGGLLERMEQLPESDMSRNLRAAMLYYLLYFDEDNTDIERCCAMMQAAKECGCYALRPVMWCNVLTEMGTRQEEPSHAEEYLCRAYAVTHEECALEGERLQLLRTRAAISQMLAAICAQTGRPAQGLLWRMRQLAAHAPILLAKTKLLLAHAAAAVFGAAENALCSLRPDALIFAMAATALLALMRGLLG